jgi:hypothetical protein
MTVVTGIGAGASLDRSFVQLPAFRTVGLQQWASFSRGADLANGLFWYPSIGIGSAALGIVASGLMRRENRATPLASALVYGAAVCTIGALAATTQAAPNMLRLRRIADDDGAALQASFRGFERWHGVRASLQLVAFALSVGALASLECDATARSHSS